MTRLYDDELRALGLRTTEYSLLRVLSRSGELRQRDLGERAVLDETTLTRNLAPLVKGGRADLRPGADRREKLLSITEAGTATVREAGPAWERAQGRMRSLLPEEIARTIVFVASDGASFISVDGGVLLVPVA